jgi:hypothetical protein
VDVLRGVVKLYRQYAEVLRAVNEVSSYDEPVRQFWRSRLDRFSDRAREVLTAEQDAAGRALGKHMLDFVRRHRGRPVMAQATWNVERAADVRCGGFGSAGQAERVASVRRPHAASSECSGVTGVP